MRRLRDGALILPGDEEHLKQLEWVMKEPDLAKSARCRALRKNRNSRGRESLIVYATLVEDYESCTNGSIDMSDKDVTFSEMSTCLRFYTKIRKCRTFSLNEHIQFLDNLVKKTQSTCAPPKSKSPESKDEEQAEFMALLCLTLMHLFRITTVMDRMKNYSSQSLLSSVLTKLYEFFADIVSPGCVNSKPPSNEMKLRSTLVKSDGKFCLEDEVIQSRDWVKRVIRISKDEELPSEDGDVYAIHTNDAKAHAMKWLELSIAQHALFLSDGDRSCYEWSRVLRDGAKVSTPDGLEVRKRPFDLAGCINTLHYVEHCLDVSPSTSDNFAKQWIDRIWMNSNLKITLPFDQLPLSMIERVYCKKTKWSVDFQLSIVGSITSEESFSRSSIQILLSCALEMKRNQYQHSAYKLTENVGKLEPHLARLFLEGGTSMRNLIAQLLTCVFELDPFHNKAFLLLDFIRSLRTQSAEMATSANAIETEFQKSSLAMLEKKVANNCRTYSDTSKAKYLSIMFLFGKHKPLERLFSKKLVSNSGRSDFESWLVSIQFFSRDCIMALICKDLSSASKLRDLLCVFNRSIETLPAHVGYNTYDLRDKKLNGISAVLQLCSIATKHTEILQPLMIPLVKRAMEFARSGETHNNHSQLFSEKTCQLYHRILDVLLHVSSDKGKDNVAVLIFQVAEIVQKDFDKEFPATGTPPYNGDVFSGAIRYLVFILYCDMKVYGDIKYSRFSKSLHSVFRLQDHCFEYWCHIIQHILVTLAKKLTNQEIRHAYSRYDTIRPFREDKSLLPDVKHELAISALFTVGGPLELCIGIGLKYFLCDGWNESTSKTRVHLVKFENYSAQMNGISDDWNLKQRNPVLAQRLLLLSGFSSENEINYSVEVEKLKDLVLDKAIMTCKMNAKSSDKIYETEGKPSNMNAALILYQRFIAQILQCHIAFVRGCYNLSTVHLRKVVANILYLWPVAGEMSGPATSKRIQDLISRVVTSCSYFEERTCTVQNILKSVQLQIRNILPDNAVDKSSKSVPALVKQRVKDLLLIVEKQLKTGRDDSQSAQQDLYYNSINRTNSDTDHFGRFQPLLFEIMNIVNGYGLIDDDVSRKLAILADLKDGLDLIRWRSLNYNESIFLSDFICRWTHNQGSFVDLYSMEENLSDSERRRLMKVWVSYYRRDFASALAHLDELYRQPLKLNMCALLPMLIYAAADSKNHFSDMRMYSTFPSLPGNTKLPLSSSLSYTNKRTMDLYVDLVPKLMHGDDPDDASARLAKLALMPSLTTWSAAQLPDRVETDLFDVLLSTDPSIQQGLRFECLVPLLVIASEKKTDHIVTKLFNRLYAIDEYIPVPMNYFPQCDEKKKILGEALNSNLSFQKHYEKFVLNTCLKETFVSTSSSVATSYLAFVEKYIPNSWLRLSSQYLLTKGVARFLELEKVMEEPENSTFCQEFNWTNLKAKCLRSLCPSGDLTSENVNNFVDSWIHLSEMGSDGGASSAASLKNSIIETLRGIKFYQHFTSSNIVPFIMQLLLLAEKIPSIASSDVEPVISSACLIFGYKLLCLHRQPCASLQTLFGTKLNGANYLPMRLFILNGLFGGLEQFLNNNTVSRQVKSQALDAIVLLKTLYEPSNHDRFMQRLEKMKVTLRRKKPFLKHLGENWSRISRRT